MLYDLVGVFIDGQGYLPGYVTSWMALIIAALGAVCVHLAIANHEKNQKINELQNLVDYYYYEDLIK